MTTLVNLLHRFEQFVNAHQQITTFSHGQITDLDTFKETDFPVMHVVWNGATPSLENNGSGVMNWDFQVLFLDKPNINEDKTNQAKYVQSDCAQYALDLLATIRFGDIFDEDVEVASAGLQAITESFTNVLWGAALNLGLLTDYDVNYCDAPLDEISGGFTPCTLCGLIAGANAVQIVDCLSEAQEAAISALICPSTEPATYTNGAAFTQEIASGETYTAPQVRMTAVDGTTEDIPANEDYTCEWKVVNVRSTDGVFTATVLSAYPAGGNSDVLAYRFRNSDNGFFANIPARNNVRLVNADFALIENDTPTPATTNLTIEVDVPVNNSNGDSVGSNVDDLLNPHVLPDLPVTDSNGAVGSYPMPTALAVVGQVNSATYSGGTLTITPAGGAAGGIAPMPVFATQVNLFGETGFVEGAQIAAGIFDPPTGSFSNCQALDYAAASPFITLKHAHLGGTARWRDSSNNALAYGDATVADGLVTDLGFDRQWYIVRQSAANFQAALDAAAAATYGGHTDWRLPTRSELWTLFDLNNTNFINSIDGRPPGFDVNSTNSVVSCTTAELASTLAYGTFGTNRRTQFFNKANSVFYILVRNFGSY